MRAFLLGLCVSFSVLQAKAEDPFFIGTKEAGSVLEKKLCSEPQQIKPVGTSSTSLKWSSNGKAYAAFKPKTAKHPRGYLNEVAAYRVAQLLGMDNVPPATLCTFRRQTLAQKLQFDSRSRHKELDSTIKWDADDVTEGAAMAWVSDLTPLGLDTSEGIAEWSKWLSQNGELPDEKTTLASDISTMLMFDYLIGNFDRFSGSNVQGTADGKRVYIRDHNLSFLSPFPESLHKRVLKRMLLTERFSKKVIAQLSALDAKTLETAFKLGDGTSALAETQIRDMLDRRDAIKSHVVALIAQYGEDKVLVFP